MKSDPSKAAGDEGEAAAEGLMSRLLALPEVLRHILLLSRFEGIGDRLLADTLGCEVATIERACGTALLSLRPIVDAGPTMSESDEIEAAIWARRIAISTMAHADVEAYEAWCAQTTASWKTVAAMSRLWDGLADHGERWEILRLRAGSLIWLGGIAGEFGAGTLQPGS